MTIVSNLSEEGQINPSSFLSDCATERRNLAVDEGLSPPRWDSLTHQEHWRVPASHIQVSFLCHFTTRDSNVVRIFISIYRY